MDQQHHRLFRYPGRFELSSGRVLPGYHLAFHTYGRLNARRDNVAWVFHALTGNSDPLTWWSGLIGAGKMIDPKEYFIVCVNMPGSCYGSIGPLEEKPGAGRAWLHDFPTFTIRDMVRAYRPLKAKLGIGRIRVGIGGSMGGQQLLQWAVDEPDTFDMIIPIATNAWHSPWGKAWNESQRWCIESDPSWGSASPEAGMEGMKIARSMALLSYRHYHTYSKHQSAEGFSMADDDRPASYQRYQGEKLAKRFNAFSYYLLTRSMDSHNLGDGKRTPMEALAMIRSKALVIGLQSDLLFPVEEQRFLARYIPRAELVEIDSITGHDGFLLEFEAIEKAVRGSHVPVS